MEVFKYTPRLIIDFVPNLEKSGRVNIVGSKAVPLKLDYDSISNGRRYNVFLPHQVYLMSTLAAEFSILFFNCCVTQY
jgi:hypothetical protein